MRQFVLGDLFLFYGFRAHRLLHSFPTRRSSDLSTIAFGPGPIPTHVTVPGGSSVRPASSTRALGRCIERSEEHTSELQSLTKLVCRLTPEKKNPVPPGPSPPADLSAYHPGPLGG